MPALAQHGVKYISDGPNEGDRIGYVRVQWENNPFYWQSPSGREKVLYWGAQGGYSIGHHFKSIAAVLPVLFHRLDEAKYPYDIVQLRWTKGDNGPPDETVMDAVRDWNAKHAYPRLIIATTSEAFHAFEKRYGDKLPTHRGDLTPYWEDGAGSGALETAMNRHSADRLLQAETLWALLCPISSFPAADFAAAWKNVALWSEHTWGAYNSVSAARFALRQDPMEVQAGLRPGRRSAIADTAGQGAGRAQRGKKSGGCVQHLVVAADGTGHCDPAQGDRAATACKMSKASLCLRNA